VTGVPIRVIYIPAGARVLADIYIKVLMWLEFPSVAYIYLPEPGLWQIYISRY
jgi:hypothetical protein